MSLKAKCAISIRKMIILAIVLMLGLNSFLIMRATYTFNPLTYDDMTMMQLLSHSHNGTLRIDSVNEKKDELANTKEDDGFLDFFVMGFPKCGTTSMSDLFQEVVNETVIIYKQWFPPRKDGKPRLHNIYEYGFRGVNQAVTLIDKIKRTSKKYNETKKFGIKWPTALEHPSVIRNLIEVDKRHRNTKIIIGMRHPVKWFESFYNYRLLNYTMPPANKLIGGREIHVRGVRTGLAQYEKYFMQFGKVDLTKDELGMLHNHKPDTTLLSTPNKIFLYTIEQFKDKNVTRANKFFNDLASFMKLEETITLEMMPKSNVYDDKTKDDILEDRRFKICDDENKEVRKVLVENGKVTANWFQSRLSKEVDIGGREHFFALLETWKEDPCVA